MKKNNARTFFKIKIDNPLLFQLHLLFCSFSCESTPCYFNCIFYFAHFPASLPVVISTASFILLIFLRVYPLLFQLHLLFCSLSCETTRCYFNCIFYFAHFPASLPVVISTASFILLIFLRDYALLFQFHLFFYLIFLRDYTLLLLLHLLFCSFPSRQHVVISMASFILLIFLRDYLLLFQLHLIFCSFSGETTRCYFNCIFYFPNFLTRRWNRRCKDKA